MSSDFAIKVESLSKCYHIYNQPQDRLLQILARGRKQYYQEYWVIQNLSFEVPKGTTFGIVGKNGSGKSTLLQLICGTLNPTSGTVQTIGRIGALLELGSGFNPEFTGRENVYLNASILGLSKKEVDAKFNQIVAFADIGEFIEQPTKNYSSGMVIRLAFAVLAHIDPDILVIDEALSVGDVFFQQKCLRFLRDFQNKKGTILFVSHDTGTVLSLCDQAALLSNNNSVLLGDAKSICKQYLEDLYLDPQRKASVLDTQANHISNKTSLINYDSDKEIETIYSVSNFNESSESFGSFGAKIYDAGFFDSLGERLNTFKAEEEITFKIKIKVDQRIIFPAFGFMLKNKLGEYIYTEGTDLFFRSHEIVFEQYDYASAKFTLTMPHLMRGKYSINVAFAEGIGDDHIQHHWIHDAIELDVLSGKVVHGYSGMSNVKMSIEVNRENAN